MLLSLLAIASMFVVSDREDIWNLNKFADTTNYISVDETQKTSILTETQVEDILASLEGKNVLILAHGLDVMPMRPISYYFVIKDNVNGTAEKTPYDYVIGYLWPSFDQYYDYYFSEDHANKAAPRFRSLLQKIKDHGATQIDVVAHSMGNRLVLESLNFAKNSNTSNLIHRFFAVAPAVNDTSIDKDGSFYEASLNCDQMFVFYSLNDRILKWEYPILKWHQALGYEGDSYPRKLSPHIQMIDCSQIVDSHESYLFTLPVFNYIQQASQNPMLDPQYVQDVLIHGDSTYSIKRTRNPSSQENISSNTSEPVNTN